MQNRMRVRFVHLGIVHIHTHALIDIMDEFLGRELSRFEQVYLLAVGSFFFTVFLDIRHQLGSQPAGVIRIFGLHVEIDRGCSHGEIEEVLGYRSTDERMGIIAGIEEMNEALEEVLCLIFLVHQGVGALGTVLDVLIEHHMVVSAYVTQFMLHFDFGQQMQHFRAVLHRTGVDIARHIERTVDTHTLMDMGLQNTLFLFLQHGCNRGEDRLGERLGSIAEHNHIDRLVRFGIRQTQLVDKPHAGLHNLGLQGIEPLRHIILIIQGLTRDLTQSAEHVIKGAIIPIVTLNDGISLRGTTFQLIQQFLLRQGIRQIFRDTGTLQQGRCLNGSLQDAIRLTVISRRIRLLGLIGQNSKGIRNMHMLHLPEQSH